MPLTLKHLIDESLVISFDVFDTLIKRAIPDEKSLFELIQETFNESNNIKISNFVENRIEAHKLSISKKSDGESSLDDIYSNLNFYSIARKAELKRIEISIQTEVCFANPDIKKVFEYCKQKRKKIIVTSDMYLSKLTIKQILDKTGYNGYSDIFVSCECGASKRSGKIFQQLISQLKVKSTQILHIGDSKQGDFIRPMLNGMKAYLYNPKLQIDNLKSWLNRYSVLTLPAGSSEQYTFGYSYLGPLLYAFTFWLRSHLRADSSKKVFFLAREGLLLNKAYLILSNNSDAESTYLYVSRHSTVLPSIIQNADFNQDNLFNEIFFHLRFISYADLLHEMDFDSEQISAILKELSINPNSGVSSKLPDVLKETIQQKLSTTILSQRKLLKLYLLRSGFDDDSTVVDIGWRGSMQRALDNIHVNSNFSQHLRGYYLGLSSETLKKSDIQGEGCVFSRENDTQYERMLTGFRGLMEGFFLAGHGTTLSYHYTNEQVIPILDQPEYGEDDLNIVQEMQQAALDFITNLHQDSVFSSFYPSAKLSFSDLANKVMRPDPSTFALLRNIPVYNYGIIHPMVPHLTIFTRLNPRELYKLFIKSPWRIGFLKELLRLPLNYRKIYEFLQKFQHA